MLKTSMVDWFRVLKYYIIRNRVAYIGDFCLFKTLDLLLFNGKHLLKRNEKTNGEKKFT